MGEKPKKLPVSGLTQFKPVMIKGHVCVYVFMYVCIFTYVYMSEREIDFKKLSSAVVDTGESETCRAGEQAGDPEKSQCCSSSLKAICWQNSLFLRGDQSFSSKGLQLI